MVTTLKKILKSRLAFIKRNIFLVDIVGVSIFIVIFAIVFFCFPRPSTYVTVLLDVSKIYNLDRNEVNDLDTPPFWFIEEIRLSTLENNKSKNDDIQIKNIYVPENGETNKKALVELQIKTIYNKQTEQYSYGGTPLLIGSYQRFRLHNIELNGVVREISSSDLHQQPLYIEINAYLEPLNYPPYIVSLERKMTVENNGQILTDGIPSYIAEKIEKGLVEKDSNNELLAEIMEITKQPGTRKIISNGFITNVADEDRQKVTLMIKIRVDKYGNNYYFLKQYPVLIGNTLFLNFYNLRLPITITDINE